MNPNARMARLFPPMGVASLLLALASCSPSPEAPQTADQAARAACRAQTEQSYNLRNRADLYKPDYGRDAPLSGQMTPQVDRGLSDRYSYEQSYQDCLRSRGARQTPTSLTPTELPAAPAQPATPSSVPPPADPSNLARPPGLTH